MGGESRVSLEIIFSRYQNTSQGEPFCVSESFWYRKNLCIRRLGGSFINCRRKFFVSVLKNFVDEHFSVSLISGIERSFSFMMVKSRFPSILFCLTVPECFVGEPLCVLESSDITKF